VSTLESTPGGLVGQPSPPADARESDVLARGRRVLALEREALAEAERRLGPSFVAAVQLIAGSSGRVIVSGVGKSGHVARKIAATLTSTGTAATFLHPAESLHGDLGIVGADDVAILISKSGDTVELVALLEHLKRFGVKVIAMTADQSSALGRHADVWLDAWVREEACPHDLAPTTSTTVALALGDALAVALLQEKGFGREDFARLHPGGSLGRQLLTRVADVMIEDDLPLLGPDDTMREAVVVLMRRRGIVIVTDGTRRVLGVVTTGDLVRLMDRDEHWQQVRLRDVMTTTPQVAELAELGSAVVYRMEQFSKIAMPVIDHEGSVVGVVHLHDLMRAGVV
jgi:arabinose-5-phosphate isomerase